MTDDFSTQRCSVYPDRVAVARCPECRKYFSRECITEHEGRVICASCLETLVASARSEKRRLRLPLVPLMQAAFALVFMWLLFYGVARILILIPSDFHEGTLWSEE